jgi:DNA-directed RNA polymerase subunit alpha
MLQLKKLRMKLHDTNEARLRLYVRGEGVVTAADIQTPPEVEVVNPDLYLLTVDDPKVELEVEMVVERGRGYSPASDRSGRLPIGELPIDAIYNPVRRVNWEVGSARVGQSTNYDRLVIELWTDGTVPPEEALSTGAKLLIEQLRHIAQVDEVQPIGAIAEGDEPGTGISHEIKETPIENLDLSVRVFNSLKRAGITTVGEVLDLMDKGEEQIKTIRNFGDKSFEELLEKMQEKGYLQDSNTVKENLE